MSVNNLKETAKCVKRSATTRRAARYTIHDTEHNGANTHSHIKERNTHAHKQEINMRQYYMWDHRLLNLFLRHTRYTGISKQISIAYGTCKGQCASETSLSFPRKKRKHVWDLKAAATNWLCSLYFLKPMQINTQPYIPQLEQLLSKVTPFSAPFSLHFSRAEEEDETERKRMRGGSRERERGQGCRGVRREQER